MNKEVYNMISQDIETTIFVIKGNAQAKNKSRCVMLPKRRKVKLMDRPIMNNAYKIIELKGGVKGIGVSRKA